MRSENLYRGRGGSEVVHGAAAVEHELVQPGPVMAEKKGLLEDP